jgi:hypothetical protein
MDLQAFVSEGIEQVQRSASFIKYENQVREITRNYLQRELPPDESGNIDKFEAIKIVLASFQYGKTKEFTNNVYLLLACFVLPLLAFH